MGKVKDVVIKQQEDEELSMLQEEAHYEHTMRDVIDLMVVYGFDVVMDDIKDRLEGITIK